MRIAVRADSRAILLRKLLTVGVLIILAGLLAIAARRVPLAQLPLAVLIIAILAVVWSALEWWCEAFVMTEDRVIWVFGVLRRARVEIRLEQVRHLVVTRSIRERLFGLATIGVASAGTGSVELVWNMVADPERLADTIRDALDRRSADVPASSDSASSRPLVLGVVGGIGAGKSAVARSLAARGFVIVDSDRAAHEALERPAVRETLRSWWGERVLTPEGRVDRRAVAAIVFADAAQRARLEALVHPIVKEARVEAIRNAGAANARGVVVDAPLLYEAGVDQECDAVLFVDAPRELRLERVDERGWDAPEFDRREASQLPLDEKRRRADVVVINDSTEAVLDERVGVALDRLGSPPDRPAG